MTQSRRLAWRRVGQSGVCRENRCSEVRAIGAPVLMAPSRLLGRSEGRCGTNPPGQERDH
jgi:hypothetical protein